MSIVADNRSDAGRVQVVERVAAILLALRGERDGLSLAEIAARVGLPRSTVHRLITALEHERFVVAASASGGFRLGPALASLAVSTTREVAFQIHPYLAELSRALDETVDLAVLEHDQVVFIDQVGVSTQRLRAVSAVGAVFPAYCTANGKALLAGLSDAEVERVLPARLDRFTPNTITSRVKLFEELEGIRATGVGYDREEHTLGICAVGASVQTPDGPVVAVSVPLPAQRFYGNEAAVAAALRRTQATISRALGALNAAE